MLTLTAVGAMALVTHANVDSKVNEVVRVPKSLTLFKPNEFCNAIIKGDVALVTQLIAEGENINAKSMGMTPAHYAARYNKAEILEVLIKNGANLKKRCDRGYTVRKYAEISGAKDALAVLKTS